MATCKGIDVSRWQSVNTVASYAKDVDFVICKATEGKTFRDSKFEQHISTAINMGKLIGAYHFARPDNNKMLDEAKFFISRVRKYLGNLVLALDWEGKALNYDWKVAKEFLDYVYYETGVKPLFYTSYAEILKYDELANYDYGLWVASYSKKGDNFGMWKSPAMWQYTNSPVDQNIFYGSKNQLKKYAKQNFNTTPIKRCPHCGGIIE